MPDTWVNAVIELTVPLDDVTVDSADTDKVDAAVRVMERLHEANLPSEIAEAVGTVTWEDVTDG